MRTSKQRDVGATFFDRFAGSCPCGPHGAGGSAGPRPLCAPGGVDCCAADCCAADSFVTITAPAITRMATPSSAAASRFAICILLRTVSVRSLVTIVCVKSGVSPERVRVVRPIESVSSMVHVIVIAEVEVVPSTGVVRVTNQTAARRIAARVGGPIQNL